MHTLSYWKSLTSAIIVSRCVCHSACPYNFLSGAVNTKNSPPVNADRFPDCEWLICLFLSSWPRHDARTSFSGESMQLATGSSPSISCFLKWEWLQFTIHFVLSKNKWQHLTSIFNFQKVNDDTSAVILYLQLVNRSSKYKSYTTN